MNTVLSEGKNVPVLDYILNPVSNPLYSEAVPLVPYTSSSVTRDLTETETTKPVPESKDESQKSSATRPTPFTAPWVVRRIKEDKIENALTTLRVWMPDKRRLEANEETIRHIVSLSDDEAIEAIRSLKGPKRFVRGSKGMQLSIPVALQTLDMKSNIR